MNNSDAIELQSEAKRSPNKKKANDGGDVQESPTVVVSSLTNVYSEQLKKITTDHDNPDPFAVWSPQPDDYYQTPTVSVKTMAKQISEAASYTDARPSQIERTITRLSPVTEFHKCKDRLLNLLIPIAAILVIVSAWSIYSTQWAMTKLKDHPNGITQISFGPIQVCVSTEKNYNCELNFIDSGSNEQLFNLMRFTAGASFVFSGLVFMSLWERRSFGKYRQNLNLIHIVLGVGTVVLWFMVGESETSWKTRRHYVWATFTDNGSETSNIRFGFILFCLSNILAPIVYKILFGCYLDEDDYDFLFQMQSEMQYTYKQHLMELSQQLAVDNSRLQLMAQKSDMSMMTDNASTPTISRMETEFQSRTATYFQEAHGVSQSQIKRMHTQKQKESGSAIGFAVFLFVFGCVIYGTMSSSWAVKEINLDLNQEESLAFQQDFMYGTFSDSALVLDENNTLESLAKTFGGATEISYGPFTSCLRWNPNDEQETDTKIERYRMCKGGHSGNKKYLDNYDSIHNWVVIVVGVAAFFTLFTVTPIFTNYHYITAYLQLVLPFSFFIFSIVAAVVWNGANAGDDYLPQTMEGIWAGKRGNGWTIFICAFVFFWLGSLFWSCCLNGHDGDLDVDNRTIFWFCFATFRTCNSEFMTEEQVEELKMKADRQKKIQYFYKWNRTLKGVQYTLVVILVLYILQLFGAWISFDMKYDANGESVDLSIRQLLFGRLCIVDNNAEFFHCKQMLRTIGSRSRFSLIQIVIYTNFASVLFTFWHFWEYLRNSRPAGERTFWGLLSLLAAFISLVTFFAGAKDCNFDVAGFADYTGTSDLKFISPFRECGGTFASGYKTDSDIDIDFTWKMPLSGLLYVAGACLYVVVFAVEIYVYFNQDEFYHKSDHILEFEEMWRSRMKETRFTDTEGEELHQFSEVEPITPMQIRVDNVETPQVND